MKMTAFSYLRFSHPDQAKGDSLRRQAELRDGWLARNRIVLDTSLTLEDKGVSGYTGEHRDNPDRHALATFRQLVKDGRVKRGSYLIVESLDRLTREDIIPALTLILELIQSGVRIVQLLPSEVVYDAKANPMHVMMMIAELTRGNSESAMKSERVGRAWREKKRRAAENGEPLTARGPAWLKLADGKWQVIESAAKTVRMVYQWATEGFGASVITKRLNAEKIPAIADGRHWARSYVLKLLRDRRVLGEYQPRRGRGQKRTLDGKPIPNYYPAIIKQDDWYAASASLTARRGKAGRPAKEHINVFAGLLHNARGGGMLHVVDKGSKSCGRQLIPYNAVQGVNGSDYASFPFLTFERAVLSCLSEIDAADILPKKDKAADKSLALAGRLAEVETEIEKLKSRLAIRYSDAVADVLEQQAANRKALVDQLTQARQEAASPLGETWERTKSLVAALEESPDPDAARIRLRAALRRICDGIWCIFVSRRLVRLAAVTMRFNGGAYRNFVIFHRPPTGGAVGDRPGRWAVLSTKHPDDLLPFDRFQLDDVDDAVGIQSYLNNYPDAIMNQLLREGERLP